MSTTDADRLLRAREVADMLRVSTMTVYRLIGSGEIVATRVGHSYRIFESEVRDYLARGNA